ncbi:MAG: hypothetical protein ACMXX5_01305 [Candidatus Woesearchaeota archaeon]
MRLNLEQLLGITETYESIHSLFDAHRDEKNFDWRMRRCNGDYPFQGNPYWEKATPEAAAKYLVDFIEPYLSKLYELETKVQGIEHCLIDGIKERISDSIAFAENYRTLLREFHEEGTELKAQRDNKGKNKQENQGQYVQQYNEMIKRYFSKFNELGSPRIVSRNVYLNQNTELALIDKADNYLAQKGKASQQKTRTICKILGIEYDAYSSNPILKMHLAKRKHSILSARQYVRQNNRISRKPRF